MAFFAIFAAFSAFFAIKIFELVGSRVRFLQGSCLEKPLIAKLAEAAAKIAEKGEESQRNVGLDGSAKC